MSEAPPPDDSPNEEPDAAIGPVVEELKALDPNAVKAVLDRKLEETHAVDPSAGIVIADLLDAQPVDVNGQTFRFHGARILPAGSGAPNYVRPHVHDEGEEPYLIFDGAGGEMNTGYVSSIVSGDRVVWDPPKTVSPGEVIVIEEGEVHSLRNTGSEPFDFAFACPDSHLVDYDPAHPEGGGDRVFTEGMEDALPSHYPQPAA